MGGDDHAIRDAKMGMMNDGTMENCRWRGVERGEKVVGVVNMQCMGEERDYEVEVEVEVADGGVI